MKKSFCSMACLSLTSFSLILLTSCAEKKAETNLSLAGNRTMGVLVREVKGASSGQALDTYFSALTEWTLKDTYSSKTISLPANKNSLETPENLYQVGVKGIDDLFVVDVILKSNFNSPAAAPSGAGNSPAMVDAELKRAMADSNISSQAADISVTIYNGANLRAVTAFKATIPLSRPDLFADFYKAAFKKSSNSAFPNPNIYPRGKPAYYANALYNFSKQREKDTADKLTCENASEVLGFYPKADELYRIAIARGIEEVTGQQDQILQLSSREADSADRAKVIDDCKFDAKRAFQVDWDYGSLAKENIPFIQDAFQNAELEAILKKYSNRPVKLRFHLEGDTLNLFVDIRYNNDQYHNWLTALKIPERTGAFHILALDPYHALMQKLVVFRASLPMMAPAPLQHTFNNMRISLSLKTLLNGQVTMGVDGHYLPDRKAITMAYPKTIILNSPGYDAKTLDTRDERIFQDKGYIALGNCKTVEGIPTEDGLVYKFFGLNCQ